MTRCERCGLRGHNTSHCHKFTTFQWEEVYVRWQRLGIATRAVHQNIGLSVFPLGVGTLQGPILKGLTHYINHTSFHLDVPFTDREWAEKMIIKSLEELRTYELMSDRVDDLIQSVQHSFQVLKRFAGEERDVVDEWQRRWNRLLGPDTPFFKPKAWSDQRFCRWIQRLRYCLLFAGMPNYCGPERMDLFTELAKAGGVLVRERLSLKSQIPDYVTEKWQCFAAEQYSLKVNHTPVGLADDIPADLGPLKSVKYATEQELLADFIPPPPDASEEQKEEYEPMHAPAGVHGYLWEESERRFPKAFVPLKTDRTRQRKYLHDFHEMRVVQPVTQPKPPGSESGDSSKRERPRSSGSTESMTGTRPKRGRSRSPTRSGPQTRAGTRGKSRSRQPPPKGAGTRAREPSKGPGRGRGQRRA